MGFNSGFKGLNSFQTRNSHTYCFPHVNVIQPTDYCTYISVDSNYVSATLLRIVFGYVCAFIVRASGVPLQHCLYTLAY